MNEYGPAACMLALPFMMFMAGVAVWYVWQHPWLSLPAVYVTIKFLDLG